MKASTTVRLGWGRRSDLGRSRVRLAPELSSGLGPRLVDETLFPKSPFSSSSWTFLRSSGFPGWASRSSVRVAFPCWLGVLAFAWPQMVVFFRSPHLEKGNPAWGVLAFTLLRLDPFRLGAFFRSPCFGVVLWTKSDDFFRRHPSSEVFPGC